MFMPKRNPSPCSTPECPGRAPRGGRCPECRARVRKLRAAVDATYDRTWADTSRVYLSVHPICEWPRCSRRATETDHIDGLGPSGPRGHDWTNLRGLCKPHHSSITASAHGFGTRL